MDKHGPFQEWVLKGEELESFLQRVRPGVSEEDFQRIDFMSRKWTELLVLAQHDALTNQMLRRMLFGPKTEKTRAVCPSPVSELPPRTESTKNKPKGHGRGGAAQYTGARRVVVCHPTIKPGHVCEKCRRGKLRLQKNRGVAVSLVGMPPITATVWELEKVRCDTCGEVFTAPTPREAGEEKYDPSVGVMVGLLRFGTGVPHHRLARLQASLGVPMPESTQWEQMEPVAEQAGPIVEELIRQAAQSPLVYHDDTPMRVAELRRPGAVMPIGMDPQRKGCFTTSVLGEGQHPVALFFTGRQHAGENLADVLKHRAAELEQPIQMCDALSRNMSLGLPTILANCLAHGRREFTDVAGAFPEQTRHVLEQLKEVYRVDAETKKLSLTPEQRLAHHQTHSRPVMEELQRWLKEQIDQKKVEPNSGLGKAISYMLRHWEPLTLFLRRAGAPLDNNICERALKMAIQHRKNSMSYKTLKGARVGDLFMTVIHTCRLNRENPFEYLLSIARNAKAVLANPRAWLPWNYPSAARRTDTG